MTETKLDRISRISLTWDSPVVSYAGAVLSVWMALCLWKLFPALHHEPFALFLAAVVVAARFFGFGPALFASLLSTACLDWIVLHPQVGLTLRTRQDLERLIVFLTIAVLIGSLVRQKTRAELRADRTRSQMAAIVEYSDDAIFSTGTGGLITSWNRGAQDLYGYTAEEAIGCPISRLAPPEKQDEVMHNYQVIRSGGRVASYQSERLHKDGTRVPVLLSASALRNAEGKPAGASIIARDISAQLQSQEAVRRSEKLATAGRLAASVAHEINNPLEAVLNLLYLARHDPAQSDRYLSMAEQEVGHIAHLTQQTLGFVRDSATPGLLNPATIADEILLLYSRKLEDKKIQVTRRYRPDVEVNGYSGELRQLLANLLVNSVEAMPEGGSLHVRVAPAHRWSNGSGGVRITVADNGSGIPREALGRIFEPFFTTKQDTGTGLGLWVSAGIVQKHGGAIRVRSQVKGPRHGTAFTIFLPSAGPQVPVA